LGGIAVVAPPPRSLFPPARPRNNVGRRPSPSLRAERALWQDGVLRVVGVDEVGMGPVCGPVVAAAVLLPVGCRRIRGVDDSKVLSALQRRRLYDKIRKQALSVGVGAASVKEIDSLNILRASRVAMQRALRKIGPYDHALIDGRPIKHTDLGPHSTIVDGDALCYSIACASIVAKVIRDRLMERLSRRHPGYGWEQNAGYNTRAHQQAIRTLGVTPYHRRSFTFVQMALGLG
jgi:ribonuclease HII